MRLQRYEFIGLRPHPGSDAAILAFTTLAIKVSLDALFQVWPAATF